MRTAFCCLCVAAYYFSPAAFGADSVPALRVTSVRVYTPPLSARKRGDVELGGSLLLSGVEVRAGVAALPGAGAVRVTSRVLALEIASSFSSCCAAGREPAFSVLQAVVKKRRAEVTVSFGGALAVAYTFGPRLVVPGNAYMPQKEVFVSAPDGFSITDARLDAGVRAAVEAAGRRALLEAGKDAE